MACRVIGLMAVAGWMAAAGPMLPGASAEEASPPPSPPSQTFNAGYDLVWDKLLDTLKSLEIEAATKDKDGGVIKTVPHRYFKISSAKFPPVQDDYRDTYEIKLEKQADKKTTVVTIKRKFEFYDRAQPPMGGWAERQPMAEKIGVSVEDIFATLSLELAAAALSTR